MEIMSMGMTAEIIEQQSMAHPNSDVWWIKLKAPAIAAAARPGQFIMLKLEHTPYILGRPFSIAGIADDCIFILYKQAGAITNLLPSLPAGKKLIAWGPLGHGFVLEHDQLNLLLVGGGVGIAPLLFAWQYFKNRTLLAGFNNWQHFNLLPQLLQAMNYSAPLTTPAGPDTVIIPQSI
jgi:dihydroorotate dehydrogenase electron transfer subunit